MPVTFKPLLLTAAVIGWGALPAAAQTPCGVVVFFDSGQAAVDAADATALEAFVAANPGAALSVTGYTDAAGSDAANLALSERRARMVAGTLQGNGAVVTSVMGAGEAMRPGTSGPNDPANRRVEVASAECGGSPVAAGPFGGSAGLAVAGGVAALALIAGGDSDSATVTPDTGT